MGETISSGDGIASGVGEEIRSRHDDRDDIGIEPNETRTTTRRKTRASPRDRIGTRTRTATRKAPGTEPENITVETRTTRKTAKQELDELRAQSQHLSVIILTILNSIAANIAGTDAQLTSFERALIEPSLNRVLMRSVGDATDISEYIDPIALVAGLGLWGMRIISVKRAAMAAARVTDSYHSPQSPTIPETNVTQGYDSAGNPLVTTVNGYRMDSVIERLTQEHEIGESYVTATG
jgi:hypothetical protein